MTTRLLASEMAEIHEAVAALLAAAGQRYTTHRRDLVSRMAAAGRPLTIAEILAASPDAKQSSLYRNLTVLSDVGAVQRLLSAGESARFELAEELTGHHHHLVCIACGSMTDVTLDVRSERAIAQAALHAATLGRFRVSGHRMDVLGTCDTCR